MRVPGLSARSFGIKRFMMLGDRYMVTTVAGLLVAIPSMFGYNWLVHNLRVVTVELDNFAQELVSKMETEFLKDDDAV